jgi:hypothetical protein
MEAAAETKRDEGVGELGTIKQASKVLNSSEDAQLKSMSISQNPSRATTASTTE